MPASQAGRRRFESGRPLCRTNGRGRRPAAPYNPAEFLGALDSLGTVSPGKIADLVLLDADPLVDIRNTRRISAVIANGRLFDRAALARLLAYVETALKPLKR